MAAFQKASNPPAEPLVLFRAKSVLRHKPGGGSQSPGAKLGTRRLPGNLRPGCAQILPYKLFIRQQYRWFLWLSCKGAGWSRLCEAKPLYAHASCQALCGYKRSLPYA
jgi:hypothetical protein